MSNTFIFSWGVFAFFLAVGPLATAAYLDRREQIKLHAENLERERATVSAGE